MKKVNILIILLVALLISSCTNDYYNENYSNINSEIPTPTLTIENLNLSKKEQLKLEFGRGFASAIFEEPKLRKFIKEEALKKFNKDYDVMYHLVKSKNLNGEYYHKESKTTVNYTSMRGLLLNYFESEEKLIEIENEFPLLTIFVPSLPENSFSAVSWDVNDESQVPVVAIRLENSNEVPVVDQINGQDYVIESDLIPGYPIVVIKNNERVVLTSSQSKSSTNHKSYMGDYDFIDDNFDNNAVFLDNFLVDDLYAGGGGSGYNNCNNPPTVVSGRDATVPDFLKNAYNIFDGVVTEAWQRDNIYYQLTPNVTTNKYVGGKYTEAVSYFQLIGDATDVFNFMSNQSNTSNPDPSRTNTDWSIHRRVPWTDGNFEIGMSIIDNAKNRPNVNTKLAFDAKPSDLFSFTHEVLHRWRGFWPIKWRRTYYKPRISGLKGIDFTSSVLGATKLHIHSWDLSEYSNIWNIEVKELDTTTEITTKNTKTKKYNTNLELSIPFGDKLKKGLKFGASLEEENKSERSYKWVQDDQFLGQFDIPFSDNALIKNPCDNKLYPKLYQSSRCAIELRPIQVEF